MARAAAVPVEDRAVRAAVLHAEGRVAAPMGELRRARDACVASVELSRELGDDRALGRALVTLGLCEWALGDLAAAARDHDEAAIRAESSGDGWHRDTALVLRLRTAIDAGEPDVEQRLDRALASVRATGDQHLIGLALGQQARFDLINGDSGRAYEAARSSLSYWRSVNYREGEIQALNLLARACVLEGRLDEAATDARTAVLAAASIGHRGGLVQGLETLAAVRHAAGLDTEALELLTVADQERKLATIPVPGAERAAVDELRRIVTDRLRADPDRSPSAPHLDLQRIIADLHDGDGDSPEATRTG